MSFLPICTTWSRCKKLPSNQVAGPARLLDLTRLLSRWGKGPMTGVDRVEYAYLDHFLQLDAPVFGLVRSAAGFLLLDRLGMRLLLDDPPRPAKPDLIGRIAYRRDPLRGGAEAILRRAAKARSARSGLRRLLQRHLPDGGTYFNVGHANLQEPTLQQLREAGWSIAVLVHDTIPLDHPEFARPDTVEPFRQKMRVVAKYADWVIHTTQAARTHTEAQFARIGRVPAGIVAPLGVSQPTPALQDLPFTPQHPYFLCLGTIEPRKNHRLLLDVWENLPAPVPRLYIAGRRGWSNSAVFDRLDKLPKDSPIHEFAGLSDGAIAALLQGAQALLFPSFAEGFGLPAVEAATLGTPAIVSDLPAFRETLQENAVYLEASDSYSWLETIRTWVKPTAKEAKHFNAPSWNLHFLIIAERI